MTKKGADGKGSEKERTGRGRNKKKEANVFYYFDTDDGGDK